MVKPSPDHKRPRLFPGGGKLLGCPGMGLLGSMAIGSMGDFIYTYIWDILVIQVVFQITRVVTY